MAELNIYGDEIVKGQSLALGNFDGVHIGHQAVLSMAKDKGAVGVVSFHPHPRRFFAPDAPPFELLDAKNQDRLLRQYGAQNVYQIGFDEALSQMSAQDFIDKLYARFEPSAIVTGEDFGFGRGREGDVEFLKSWGAKAGVEIDTAPSKMMGGEKVSSTRIREALQAGDPELAKSMLGHAHVIGGKVEKGDQRGRDLGFPTANLNPTKIMLPKFGVYATRLHVLSGAFQGSYLGASSLGVRPSFGVNKPNFETHILDFDGDIYGVEIIVELVAYLRGEEKFDNIDALIVQMDKDVERCREILNA